MDSRVSQNSPLEAIRGEIDRIDDELLSLLAQRFAAVEQIRAVKAQTAGGQGASPMRPAREAAILRRLMELPEPAVPAELRLRLWRAIIAQATLSQAPVRVHVSAALSSSVKARLMLRDYFDATPIAAHPGETMVLEALAANPGDVAAVALDSPWIDAFAAGRAGRAHVVGCLPFLAPKGSLPHVLIFGYAKPEATDADETLLMTDGQLPRGFSPAPLWHCRLGPKRITSIPGFHSEHNMPLIGLKRSNMPLALTVLGRYPSPIEIKS